MHCKGKWVIVFAPPCIWGKLDINCGCAMKFVASDTVGMLWSIKYRQKQKLIAQFDCKSRDESFEPS